MYGVRYKRVCIKFPGIGSHRCRTVPERQHESCMHSVKLDTDSITFLRTVLYVYHPILKNLIKTLLYLTPYIKEYI